MFSGLTLANLLGVPVGTWLAQTFSWRLVRFWIIAGIGVLTMASIAVLVPAYCERQSYCFTQRTEAFVDPQVLLVMGSRFRSGRLFTSITYIAPMMVQEAGFSSGGVAGVNGAVWSGTCCR